MDEDSVVPSYCAIAFPNRKEWNQCTIGMRVQLSDSKTRRPMKDLGAATSRQNPRNPGDEEVTAKIMWEES